MKRIIVIFASLIAFASLSFAQQDESEITPAKDLSAEEDSVTDADSVWAEIIFDKHTHNYGKISYAGDGSCEFEFKNTGTGPLILNNVKSSCGCTVPDWPKNPIKPGETSVIKVQYNTRRSGSFTKGITVYSNASENGTVRLIIKGEVAPMPDKPVLGE